MLAAATLLLINVPSGTALTALPGGLWFEDAGRTVSVQVIGLEDAAVAIDAARTAAADDPLMSVQDNVTMGYAGITVETEGPDGMVRRLYLSFGEEHLLLTETEGTELETDVAGPAPGGAAEGTQKTLRERLRPGSEAGHHPGRVDLVIDGYRVDDAAGVLPLDFFTGPLTLEIWPEGAIK